MFHRSRHNLTVACVVAAAMLAMPTESRAGRIWDCMFGNAPPSQTTYTPTYVAPTCVTPVYCPPVAATYAPCYVPQTCQYMPSVVYRALYAPAVVTAYRPVATCNTCVGYKAVTTYRPFLGTYQTRLVPYTTYRPIYSSVVSYGAYNPCGSCSPCGAGACGSVIYGASASSCASCSAPAPYASSQPAAPATDFTPRTFEQKVNKPAAEPELKPIPQPDTKLNSMPAPALPDPNSRTAARYSAAQIDLTARAVSVSPTQDDDGWRPARD